MCPVPIWSSCWRRGEFRSFQRAAATVASPGSRCLAINAGATQSVNQRSVSLRISRKGIASAIDCADGKAAGRRARCLRPVSGGEQVTIVTWNLKDFDRKELAAVGLVAESPDVFLCRLLAKSPKEVAAAFIRMRDNL